MKHPLLLLAWYLDFIICVTASQLIRYFFPPEMEWGLLTDLAVFIPIRIMLSFFLSTPGSLLIEPAVEEYEDPAKLRHRRWPNLIAGTMLLFSGLGRLENWLNPDYPTFFIGFRLEGIQLGVVETTLGLLAIYAGGALLRLEPIGKLIGVVLLAIDGLSLLLSSKLWDNELEQMAVAIFLSRGVEIDEREMQLFLNVMYGFMLPVIILFAALYTGLLLASRSRKALS